MSGFLKSSIGRKVAMALSAFFLMIFLLQHFIINFTSVFSAEIFNEVSQFMGTNWLIQFLMQPILIFAVVFHFVMGFVLEIRNRSARPVGYSSYKGSANSSWMSRNMIWSGGFILIFLIIHFIDFWVPELEMKYIQGDMSGMLPNGEGFRYHEELVHKFEAPWRVALYCLGFVFLSLHLLHGFMSAFQSVGANNKYVKSLRGFAKVYAILIPAGFIFIALYHHINGH